MVEDGSNLTEAKTLALILETVLRLEGRLARIEDQLAQQDAHDLNSSVAGRQP